VLRSAAGRAAFTGDYVRSDELIVEWRDLAEESGDEAEVLRALNSAALNAAETGHFDVARAQFVAIREQAGTIGRRELVAFATVNLAQVGLESGNFDAALTDAAEAVEQFRERRDDVGVVRGLHTCGLCAFHLRDTARAEGAFREALVIGARLEWTRICASLAAGLAAVLIDRHEDMRGAQLLAASASLHESIGAGFDGELEQLMYDRAVADARAALGEEAFAAACARGTTMTPDEIVESYASGYDGSSRK
jgi:tetratricopeptide (TPR) repeat protein